MKSRMEVVTEEHFAGSTSLLVVLSDADIICVAVFE